MADACSIYIVVIERRGECVSDPYGQRAQVANLPTFLKRVAHYAMTHREFCAYCPKIQDCYNHNGDRPFSKGKCEATLRRHLLQSARTGKRGDE